MGSVIKKRGRVATPEEVRAVDRLRRAERVTLHQLAAAIVSSKSVLSLRLNGDLPIQLSNLRAIRAAIRQLADGGSKG